MKRLFDVVVATMLLFLLAPVLVVVALIVWRSLGRPALLRQRRPGFGGRPFELLKFRTMSNATDDQGNPLHDEQRLNNVGRRLRQTSLDELPELINVIKGDMSLVGPRPLLMKYLDRYTPEQARRHDVKPGITGWAQVNGRNLLSWEDKFILDLWYVDHQSLWLDLEILGKTAVSVIKRKGIAAPGEATMREFMGVRRSSAAETHGR